MKKTFFLLLAVCMMPLFCGTVNAQSLIGTWATDGKALLDDEDDVEAKKAEMLLTFNGKNSLTVTFDYLMAMNEDGMSGEIGVKGSVVGTYKKSGNELNINCNKQSAKLDIYKVDINLTPEMEAALKVAGMTKQQLIKTVKDSMNPDEFASSIESINGKLIINSLTAKQLVLTDSEDGTKLTFYRK